MSKNSHKTSHIKKDLHNSPDIRKRVGIYGEDLACSYLNKLGLVILERNVRFSHGELDIVARDKNRICFIEVKTRRNLKYGRPSLAITVKKQKTVRSLALLYMKIHPEYNQLIPRIDVIEILLLENGEKYVNYIKAAF